jgi:hypothetical protein
MNRIRQQQDVDWDGLESHAIFRNCSQAYYGNNILGGYENLIFKSWKNVIMPLMIIMLVRAQFSQEVDSCFYK